MICLENVRYYLPKQNFLLQDVSLQLEPGHVYGLLGHNGAGKTTLLRLMAGLIRRFDGKATVDGVDIRQRPVNYLQRLSFVAEKPYTPPLKIYEFLDLYAPLYPSFDVKLFHTLAKTMDLNPYEYLGKLSFGYLKRFYLAFSLATQAEYLFWDEPTNGLDITTKHILRKHIASQVKEHQTMVIATHHIEEVEPLLDAIVILHYGEVIFSASLEECERLFSYKVTNDESLVKKALYAEATPMGYQVLLKREDDEETRIPLSFLFEASIRQVGLFRELGRRSQ
ncbi:ABC transporter ATP-binding protein [Thermospira aquatica]|uniref:ABC transporter ATP-binding protein n=1 Tax=Thermospira aquatica TaxID=2828656 RepID=A0AAX3BDZ3_9SPIR|nr:ABC transporter ATP-binding protein [Thermospira aquatica]URA10466.1 ABC transporter ATP-binding protein [Thermospira aquatica]